LGQLDAVDAAAFHPNDGNVAHWAGHHRATRTDAPGLHVSRRAFDRVLRDWARASGAAVADASVRRIELSDRPRIEYVTRDGRAHTRDARWVLDCSGRAGVVARRGLRQPARGYR